MNNNFIENWNRDVYRSISIDGKVEQVEKLLGCKFEKKPTNHWDLSEELIKIIENWKEYLGPNQGQKQILKEIGIEEYLKGQNLIQELINEIAKWKITMEFQKPQLIKVQAETLPEKMVYLPGCQIHLVEPYMITEEQHDELFRKLVCKTNKYLTKIHQGLNQVTKSDLTDVINQVKKKLSNVLYVKGNIPNLNANMPFAKNANKQDIPNEIVHYSHAKNVTNSDIEQKNMTHHVKNANSTDVIEKHAEKFNKKRKFQHHLTIETEMSNFDLTGMGFW